MWCRMRSRQPNQRSEQSIRRCSRKRQAADDLFDLDRPERRGRGVHRRRPGACRLLRVRRDRRGGALGSEGDCRPLDRYCPGRGAGGPGAERPGAPAGDPCGDRPRADGVIPDQSTTFVSMDTFGIESS